MEEERNNKEEEKNNDDKIIEIDNNPFESELELEPQFKNDNNKNNNNKSFGYNYINFFEKNKEVRKIIKEINEIYEKFEPIFESLINKYRGLQDIYGNYMKYKEKKDKIEEIINKIENSKNELNLYKNSLNDSGNVVNSGRMLPVIEFLYSFKLLPRYFLTEKEVKKIESNINKKNIDVQILSYLTKFFNPNDKTYFLKNIFIPYINQKINNSIIIDFSDIFEQLLTILNNKTIKKPENNEYIDSHEKINIIFSKFEDAVNYLKNNKTTMNDLFESHIIKKYECCNIQTFTIERIIKGFSFNRETLSENKVLPDKISIYDYFDLYFKNKKDYKNKCLICSKGIYYENIIYKLSKILIIFIKEENQYNETKIEEKINMTKYIYNNKTLNYNLITLIKYDIYEKKYFIIYKKKENNNWKIFGQNEEIHLDYSISGSFILIYLKE